MGVPPIYWASPQFISGLCAICFKPLPLELFLLFFFRCFTIWVPPVLDLVGSKPNCYRSPGWFLNCFLILPEFLCKIQVITNNK
jgi:hypothetical protein